MWNCLQLAIKEQVEEKRRIKQEEKERRMKEEAEKERALAQERTRLQNQYQEELKIRHEKEVMKIPAFQSVKNIFYNHLYSPLQKLCGD